MLQNKRGRSISVTYFVMAHYWTAEVTFVTNQLDTQVHFRVWGDNACFTRPEMKVERVSYDVMTPSAARGVLEAILWKPAIRWIVTRIDVLNPIRWESVSDCSSCSLLRC